MQDLAQVPDQVLDSYIEDARGYLLIREEKQRLEKAEAGIKKQIMEILEKYGSSYGPEGQHLTIDFPEPIRGYARVVRQAKVTQSVDEVEAEAIARRAGIYDRLFKPVMALDEAAVLVAVREGLITDADLAKIFPKRIIHACVPEKQK